MEEEKNIPQRSEADEINSVEENIRNKPKKTKHSFLKGFLAGAVLMLGIGAGVAAGIILFMFRPISMGNNVAASSSEAQLDIGKVAEKLELLKAYLDAYYLYDEDAQKIEDQIYKGMISGIQEDDPYAAYYTAEELLEFQEMSSGEYCGVGMLVSQLAETKESIVVKVYEGSPAEEAGFLPGDILYQVNGIDIRSMDLDYVVNQMIRGEEGSYLDITVMREGENEPLTMHCERRMVETPTVVSQMLDHGIGYVGLGMFNEVGLGQFERAVEALQEEGMEKLIIDLRGNPGGNLLTATGLLDYILPDQLTQFTEGKEEFEQGKTLLVYTRNKQDEGMAWYAEDGHALEIPIVVLIDENSASASELFSGCLQDYDAAEIVGVTSFGKGIMQSTFMLDDGSAIEFTTDMYYTPSGYSVHKQGVVPDVQVELPDEIKQQVVITEEEDTQLQAAIELLEAR